MNEPLKIHLQSKAGHEDIHFKDADAILIRKLREKNKKDSDKEYREAHANHCFRCGTKSLVEVDRGEIKIDICANENCGAIHLDAGELENIMKDEKTIKGIRKSFLTIFK